MSKTAPIVSDAAERVGAEPARARGKRLRRFGVAQRHNVTGWIFLAPAAALILWMSFWPMFQALLLSFQTGRGTRLRWAEPLWSNYTRLLSDPTFKLTLFNTFLYLLIEVPIMLILGLVLAYLLNDKSLRFKAFFRTAIFLPVAVSLVSYALVFRTLFATNGTINSFLMFLNITDHQINWLGQTDTARAVIILGLIWRWTGYNMVFYLAGLQTVDPATLEAAKIDGASGPKAFWYVAVPQLRPIILLTAIMSTNGTLQLFDESFTLTAGGPSYTSMSISHYLYLVSFQNSPNFGYAAAISYVILLIVAVLAMIQMRVGDSRA